VVQSYRTRDVSGISLGMYLMFTLGIALWLLYGWLMRAWPVVVANVLTLGLAASILALKVQSVRRGART
jgi:MtN3 and saliva related transmembrane protein